MLKVALKLLKKIKDNGYDAYIVGGYVRNYILGIDSTDFDITTNAKPMDIKNIFKDKCMPEEEYGSVRVIINNIKFEITTYRKELEYTNNRKPTKYIYINSLEDDLQRRDFTINTLCMDEKGRIIDLLGALHDIEEKVIDTVGDSNTKFKEDALRILRAVRFATTLNFTLKDEVKDAIIKNKIYLKNVSMSRKKQELDKIFSSSNIEYGIGLIKELELDKELEIYNLDNIVLCDDIIGIYSSIDVSDKYPFTNIEKETIKKVKEAIKLDNLDDMVLYKYGLYINSICASMKKINRAEVIKKYENLPIMSIKDINITGEEIMKILKKDGGPYITEIYDDLERKIIKKELKNNKKEIKQYIIINYR